MFIDIDNLSKNLEFDNYEQNIFVMLETQGEIYSSHRTFAYGKLLIMS